MLDIQLLRGDLEGVAQKLGLRGFELDTAVFKELEAQRKEIQSATEYYQSQRNAKSKEIGQAKAKKDEKLVAEIMVEVQEFGGKLTQMEAKLESVQLKFEDFLLRIPNIAHASVPAGKSPDDNVELRRIGSPRQFGFAPKDHVDIGAGLKQLDFDVASKIAGARFALMKGPLARLHRAIAQFMLDVHTQEHGYTEIYAPYLVNADSVRGTGQLPKFEEDLFAVLRTDGKTGEKFYLIPTSEVPVTNIVRDEIVPLESLPLKFVCHSPCLRSGAGSSGKPTRGMIRNHQFDKVELVHLMLQAQ